MRGLVPSLPRQAWLLLGGECLAAVGSGMTLPFVLIYLHRVRGIEIEVAGFALASLAAAGFAGNPLGGWLSDRLGARRTLAGGLLTVSAGAFAFSLVGSPAEAFAAAILFGLGAAVVWPSQDALLATLVAPDRRSAAFSMRYATMNLGLGAGAVAGAVIADIAAPRTFELLFAIQAGAFVAFAAVVASIPEPARNAAAEPYRRGTGRLRSDRALRRLLPIVALLFAAGYAQYQAAFPAFAAGPGGLGASALGAAFAANTATIVVAQLFVLRLMARRSHSGGLVLAGCVWTVAWIVALAAGGLGGGMAAAIVFALAMVLFGLGETILAPTIGPLINEIAPDDMRGRYNGACALASTTGFVAGPAVAGIVLAAGRAELLLVGLAVACALAAVSARGLERVLATGHPTLATCRQNLEATG